MTSRGLHSSEIVPFPAARTGADSAAFASPLRSATVFALEEETVPGVTDCEGNFLVGIAFALAVEACAALALVGVWRLFTVLR
jgi:hypothetical protein